MSLVHLGPDAGLVERFHSYGEQLQDLFAADAPRDPQAFAAFCQNLLVEASLLAQQAHSSLSALEPDVPAPAAPPPSTGGEGLMKRADVAEYLGVSIRFVDELVASGELVPIRLGRAVRFDRRAVDAFVRSRARSPKPGAKRLGPASRAGAPGQTTPSGEVPA